MALGDNLKEARKAKGLTQKQLADLIGAKHNSISNWENNQNRPDPDTIELICGVLDVSPSFLINGSEAKVFNVDDLKELSKIIYGTEDIQPVYRLLQTSGKEVVDLLENIVINANNSKFLSNQEIRLISYYRRLNSTGKAKSIESTKDLTLISKYSADYLQPVAAHERTDTEHTEESKKHDDDLMNDDSIWGD